VQLRNVAAVVEGSARGVIVVAAHRDTGPTGPGANDNASGTATLIQLARVYADTGAGRRPTPLHTLVFLSTDGGAWGGLGAERFARHSARPRRRSCGRRSPACASRSEARRACRAC
jgi:Zn-dependent M28 family amino/carboxypeptidase